MKQPSKPTVKRLFALSGNRCAFPECITPLIDPATGVVTGKICHIKAREEGGPRYDETQTDEQRNAFENLVLMCGVHHDVIDKNEAIYTVEVLHEIKATHEDVFKYGLEPSDKVADNLLNATYNIDVMFQIADTLIQSSNQSGGQTAYQIHNTHVVYQTSPPTAAPLSNEEEELLCAADDANGEILLITMDQCDWVSVGGKNFVDENDPAVAATYIEALESLQYRGLVKHDEGILYQLRGSGYRLARNLKAQRQNESRSGLSSILDNMLIQQELAEKKRSLSSETAKTEVSKVKEAMRSLIEIDTEKFDKMGVTYVDVREQATLQHKDYFAAVYWFSYFENSIDNAYLYMVFRRKDSSIADRPLKDFQYLPDVKYRNGEYQYGWRYFNSTEVFLTSEEVAGEIVKQFCWQIQDGFNQAHGTGQIIEQTSYKMANVTKDGFRQLCSDTVARFVGIHTTPEVVFEDLLGRLLDALDISLGGHIRAAASGLPQEARLKTMIIYVVDEHRVGDYFDPNPIMDDLGRRLQLKGYTGPKMIMDMSRR